MKTRVERGTPCCHGISRPLLDTAGARLSCLLHTPRPTASAMPHSRAAASSRRLVLLMCCRCFLSGLSFLRVLTVWLVGVRVGVRATHRVVLCCAVLHGAVSCGPYFHPAAAVAPSISPRMRCRAALLSAEQTLAAAAWAKEHITSHDNAVKVSRPPDHQTTFFFRWCVSE